MRIIKSSSPGEFHPQALPEPDVNLSIHPALIVQPSLKRLRPTHRLLPSLVDQSIRLNNVTPSLHLHYETSSLLRVTPPLCPASVLSPSWVLHLGFSLTIGTTGPHVPHMSLIQIRATFMPDAPQAVYRFPLDLSWYPVSYQF